MIYALITVLFITQSVSIYLIYKLSKRITVNSENSVAITKTIGLNVNALSSVSDTLGALTDKTKEITKKLSDEIKQIQADEVLANDIFNSLTDKWIVQNEINEYTLNLIKNNVPERKTQEASQ